MTSLIMINFKITEYWFFFCLYLTWNEVLLYMGICWQNTFSALSWIFYRTTEFTKFCRIAQNMWIALSRIQVHHKLHFSIGSSTLNHTKYSRVPNTSRVWNNGIGWKIFLKSIVHCDSKCQISFGNSFWCCMAFI